MLYELPAYVQNQAAKPSRNGVRTPRLPGSRLADPAARCSFERDMERHRRNGLRHRRLFNEKRGARRRGARHRGARRGGVRRVRAPGDAPVHGCHLREIDARCRRHVEHARAASPMVSDVDTGHAGASDPARGRPQGPAPMRLRKRVRSGASAVVLEFAAMQLVTALGMTAIRASAFGVGLRWGLLRIANNNPETVFDET